MEFLIIVIAGIAIYAYFDWRARQKRHKFVLGLRSALQEEFPDHANSFSEPVCAMMLQVFNSDEGFQKLRKKQHKLVERWLRLKAPDDIKLKDLEGEQVDAAIEKHWNDIAMNKKLLSCCPDSVRQDLIPSLQILGDNSVNYKMMNAFNRASAFADM
jgi:hypothetical protein